jgi:hypothetical protein
MANVKNSQHLPNGGNPKRLEESFLRNGKHNRRRFAMKELTIMR